MLNQYNLFDKVKARVHFQNDTRKEIEAIIMGIVYDENNIKYRIEFDPTDIEKVQGCTGCVGYVDEKDIVEKI